VRYQNESASKIAHFLEGRAEIDHVNYPGLESHPQHQTARELFEGCGGMLSFVPAGGEAATERILGALRLPIRAPSLGGPETLVSVPAHVSHASLSDEELLRVGISKALVRMSVGLENTDDLIADLTQALDASAR
jgi:cystathionine beta-lyase/cystathionine gamma-synthase